MPRIFHIDYETWSTRDLRKLGAFIYAEDPESEVLICAVAEETAEGLKGPYLWVNSKYEDAGVKSDPRAHKMLGEAFADPEAELWAHNAQFESVITEYVWYRNFAKTWTIRKPELTQWRCTAALCRKAGLPASLEDAAIALGLKNKKTWEGYSLIRLFCVPQKSKKLGTTYRVSPSSERVKWKKFCDYCLQDVRVEAEIYRALKPIALKGAELRSFQQDMIMNHRGIPVNMKALLNAKKLIQEIYESSAKEFRKLTKLEPTQRDKVLRWLKERGAVIDDLKKKTLQEWMAPDDEDEPEDSFILDEGKADATCRRVVELYCRLGYTAPKKVLAMINLASPDARVRGTLLWYGAGTGRSSGIKLQPQNFKKPEFKDTALAFSMIEEGCAVEELELLWGNALQIIASCIRHFIAGPINDADYNAIEARMVGWLSDDPWLLKSFAEGRKIYEEAAAFIFGLQVSEIKNPSFERALGKEVVLAGGYGMGPTKYRMRLAQYGTHATEEQAKMAIYGYREKAASVPALWRALDSAAFSAVKCPGERFWAGKRLCLRTAKLAGMTYLIMTLPSGRNLFYPKPAIEEVEKNGRKDKCVTYWGKIKGKTWGRISMWGGVWLENASQATAGDVLANGLANAERRGMKPFLPVHDQCLAPAGATSIADFCAALTDLPPWAEGLPIKAEGKVAPYYAK